MFIGLDPFFVFFGSTLQKQFLLDQTRKSCIISIDATGINIKPPMYSSISEQTGKAKKPFLYIISLQTDSVNVPIHQMISQRHSHDFIEYYLLHWKHRFNNGRVPQDIIMDESSALLLSCVQVFTSSKSLAEYTNDCFNALFNGGKVPQCYIRIDRAHFVVVASLMRNKYLKALDGKKRNFYLRIIGYLILCEDIREAEKVIRNTFIVMKNEYLYSEEVNKAKNDLISILRTHSRILDDYTIDGIDEICNE